MTKGTAMAQLVSLDKYRSSRRADAQSLGLKTAKGSKRRADICFDRSEFSVLMVSTANKSLWVIGRTMPWIPRQASLFFPFFDTPRNHHFILFASWYTQVDAGDSTRCFKVKNA